MRSSFRITAGVVAFHALCALGQMPTVSFSGYGTLGVVHSSDDKADFRVDSFRPTGPGYTHRWSWDVDSRLAAQMTASFAGNFSAVIQVVAQQRYDDTYTPTVEWANVKYQVTPDLAVRAGRVVLPVFMVTDSRRVGFANPWVRPPVEVYSLVPVTSNDGADASFGTAWGGTLHRFQVTAGGSDSKFPGGRTVGQGTARARDLINVSDTIERGSVTARVSAGRASLTIREFDPLFDAFRQFGPQGVAIADRYDIRDREVTFYGLGGMYDPGAWFATAEWAKFDTNSVIGTRSAWYASGGARYGKLTGYATYGRVKADSNTSDPGLPLAGLPPPLAAAAAALNAALNAQLSSLPVQRTVSIGMRYDFLRNAALKVQYDRIKRGAGSAGTFGNLQPGFEFGGKANLLSIAVDFVL
jgi:hypothetical protein